MLDKFQITYFQNINKARGYIEERIKSKKELKSLGPNLQIGFYLWNINSVDILVLVFRTRVTHDCIVAVRENVGHLINHY